MKSKNLKVNKKTKKKKEIKDIIRPDKVIKTKVRIDFGNGIYRTTEEINKLKKKHFKEKTSC